MIERIKSILLLLLVFASLYLTYQLWYGQKPTELIGEDVFEHIVFEKPRPIEQVITPSEILVHSDMKNYYIKVGTKDYLALWTSLSELLQDIGDDILTNDSSLAPEASKCVTYHFNPALPIGHEMPWLSAVSPMLIDEIRIYCSGNIRHLVLLEPTSDLEFSLLLPEDKSVLIDSKISGVQLDNLVSYTLLDDGLVSRYLTGDIEISAPIYIPTEAVYMNRYTLRPEQFNRELLLKTFFIDYNLARKIEERDGGLIYTDGEKGLRLSHTGVEFSYPLHEERHVSLSYTGALINCSNLISYHGGWPHGLYLEELNYVDWGRASVYEAEWVMYHAGYPLFTRIPTRIVLTDRGLIYYTRSIFTLVESLNENSENVTPVALWHEALHAAFNFYQDKLGVESDNWQLEYMKLGFAATGSDSLFVGEPVWVVQVNGEMLFLEAHSLKLLCWEAMN